MVLCRPGGTHLLRIRGTPSFQSLRPGYEHHDHHRLLWHHYGRLIHNRRIPVPEVEQFAGYAPVGWRRLQSLYCPFVSRITGAPPLPITMTFAFGDFAISNCAFMVSYCNCLSV